MTTATGSTSSTWPRAACWVNYSATIIGQTEPAPVAEIDLTTYLRPSRYAEADKFFGFAATEFGPFTDPTVLLEKVSAWVGSRLDYVPGSSDPIDGAVDTLLAGRGVCRDYAHLVVALLRAVNVPARLVAVYAPGCQPMDFHAVAEAFVDGPVAGGRRDAAWRRARRWSGSARVATRPTRRSSTTTGIHHAQLDDGDGVRRRPTTVRLDSTSCVSDPVALRTRPSGSSSPPGATAACGPSQPGRSAGRLRPQPAAERRRREVPTATRTCGRCAGSMFCMMKTSNRISTRKPTISAVHNAPARVNLPASSGGMTGLVAAGGSSSGSRGSGSRSWSGGTNGSLLIDPSCPLRAPWKRKHGQEPAPPVRVAESR